MVKTDSINPPSLGRPSGYSQGVRAGDFVFVSGQIGAKPAPDGSLRLVSRKFEHQFEQALINVVEVVKSAGGHADDVVELTIFVLSLASYRLARKNLRDAWLRVMGRRYPAITLVEVRGLLEKGALVEIRGVAALG
jgi:enamine deaminase RidA (YjgF/YER057c/UK114 family)